MSGASAAYRVSTMRGESARLSHNTGATHSAIGNKLDRAVARSAEHGSPRTETPWKKSSSSAQRWGAFQFHWRIANPMDELLGTNT
jgi:hypothetical protein